MITQHIVYDRETNQVLEYTEKNTDGQLLNHFTYDNVGRLVSKTIYDKNHLNKYITHKYNIRGDVILYETEEHITNTIFSELYPKWKIYETFNSKKFENIYTSHYDHRGRLILSLNSHNNVFDFTCFYIGDKEFLLGTVKKITESISGYTKIGELINTKCDDKTYIKNYLKEKYQLIAETHPLILNYNLDDYDY
jgi:hypothetical protein